MGENKRKAWPFELGEGIVNTNLSSLNNYFMKNQIFQAIDKAVIFRDFSPAEKWALTDVAEVQKYEENEVVFSYEHIGKYFYLVEEGVMTLRLRNGKVRKYFAGELFGEVAIFNRNSRTGQIVVNDKTTLLAFHRSLLTEETILSFSLALKLSNALSMQVSKYLQDNTSIPSAEVIEKGENERVEFKASVCARSAESVIRTIVAFLNSRGGTLFIGVDDFKRVVGIDGFTSKDVDRYWNRLTDCIEYRVDPCFAENLSFDIEEIKGKRVIRIDCTPAHRPALLRVDGQEENFKKEMFIIRAGPKNVQLKRKSQLIDYIQERFMEKGRA